MAPFPTGRPESARRLRSRRGTASSSHRTRRARNCSRVKRHIAWRRRSGRCASLRSRAANVRSSSPRPHHAVASSRTAALCLYPETVGAGRYLPRRTDRTHVTARLARDTVDLDHWQGGIASHESRRRRGVYHRRQARRLRSASRSAGTAARPPVRCPASHATCSAGEPRRAQCVGHGETGVRSRART